MKALEQKIKAEGVVCPGNVLKVGSFLNQQLDVDFLYMMGDEIASLFSGCGVTKVITIEASGIAIALPAAHALGVKAVFAKKCRTSNMSGDVYSARIHSFTHGNDYDAIVSKNYITEKDRVLIVDDFLAEGSALKGMISLVQQAGATVVGAAIAIEKAFQNGGDEVRAMGYRVESLARIASMTDSDLVFI